LTKGGLQARGEHFSRAIKYKKESQRVVGLTLGIAGRTENGHLFAEKGYIKERGDDRECTIHKKV